MKKIIAMLLAAVMLCGAAALADEPDSYVATGGVITDKQTYTGAWPQAYLQILANHSARIHEYQARTLEYYIGSQCILVPCKPVSLTDITGDGIPELLFVETYSEERGDLYIYSSDGTKAACVLYVPGIMRLGANDVDLGYDIYLSSAGGGTLVVEYDEYEWPWLLQLARNAFGQYTLQNYLWAKYDNSNEEDYGVFLKNGAAISWEDYCDEVLAVRMGQTKSLSTYTLEDTSHYGFDMTWEDAVASMGGAAPVTPEPTVTPNADGVWGLTIDKLATRKGPGTQYEGGGTYSVKNQYIKVLAKAWDKRNGIWWVKCEIHYKNQIRVLWTGWKRFDHSTISLDDLPEETW